MRVRRIVILIVCACVAPTFQWGCGTKLSVLKRAAQLVRQERYAEAVEAYERFIEMAGDSPESAYERAEAYFQIGCLYTYRLREPREGHRAFEQAVALRPDYADPQVHLGIMYKNLSDEDEIALRRALQSRADAAQQWRLYNRYTAMLDNSERALCQALESRPEITNYPLTPNMTRRPRVILAGLEQQRGRLNEAIQQLYTYEHYSENDAEDWLQLGALFADQEEPLKALFYYRRAFETLGEAQRGTSRYFDTRFGLIDAYTKTGSLAEAQDILKESFDVLKQYENYYSSLSDWQRREEQGLRAWLINSQRTLLEKQARVYTSQNNYEKALETLKELQSRAPEAERFLLDLAETYARVGDFKAAHEHLEMFKHLAPYHPPSLLTEATILYEEQNYDACLARLADYIRASPKNIAAQAFPGLVLIKAGKVAEGIAYLEGLCKQHPNLSPLQVKMAEALAAAGQPERALWWLRRAMETGAVFPAFLQHDRELAPLLNEPGFAELLQDVRYRISLRRQVYEAEDLLYRWETARGLAALERLRMQNPDILFTTYALARGYVFAKRADEAFPLLSECAQGELFNPDVLKHDGYLIQLHGDPRFDEVLNAIEQPRPTETSE